MSIKWRMLFLIAYFEWMMSLIIKMAMLPWLQGSDMDKGIYQYGWLAEKKR